MMRLTLVISSLGCGGAERVMSILANHWRARGWEISLMTLDDGRVQPFYDLDPLIRHVSVGVSSKRLNPVARSFHTLKSLLALRRAIRASRPDAIISFLDKPNVMTLLATLARNVPVIVSERTDPTMHSIGKIWESLRRYTYPLAELIVVQTEGAAKYFSKTLQGRVRIIPNPALTPPIVQTPPDIVFVKPLLVAMGRLGHEKGFDLLLQAFSQLKDKHRDWTLVILGEGPLRSKLESLRDKLGLVNRVFLPGQVKNPHEVLKRADLFVLPSRFEGFPNALCEAMSYGLPVIAADCPSGPREIIRNQVDGILVPPASVDALAGAMNALMGSETKRTALAARAPEVTKRFALEGVMQRWEQALDEVIRGRCGQYVQSGRPAWRAV